MTIRENIKKCFILVILIFVMVISGEVWGIRETSAAATPRSLRMLVEAEPDNLDRVYSSSAVSQPVVENVIEPLIDLGKNGEAVPKLATRWEHSADLSKWRFYLRKGVKFHNGADFTARDVVETAKYFVDQKNVSMVYPRVPLKEAVALDDYTVDLIFGKPQPLLLASGIRFFGIYPITIARDKRETAKTFAIGTGPYRFIEWRRGQYVKLAKFKDYWGPKPQIDEVVITWRAEEGVRVAALRAGEVDWVYNLTLDQASVVPKRVHRASDETVLITFDECVQKEMTGNDPIFSDKRLRLAIEHSIDRSALVSLYAGFATLSLGQFATPGDFGFNPNLKSRPYDLGKAKALVREAGAVGKTVTMGSYAGKWPKDREAAEAVAYMIEQTGLKVKLMFFDKVIGEKYRRTIGEDRKYMVDMYIAPSDALQEVETRFPKIFVEGGQHYALNDPEPTRLFAEEQAETNIAKRGEKLAKAWAYVYEQAHYVPLFKVDWLWGLAKNLEWEPDLTGRPIIANMRFTD